jgi:hypothetical protein
MLDGPENERRARGAAVISAMAGAIVIARALDDPRLSEQMLKAARRLIESGQTNKPRAAGAQRNRQRPAARRSRVLRRQQKGDQERV